MRKFSVITVVFNDLTGLSKTFCNVRAQTHLDVELIVVDGASNDGCEAFIKDRENDIDVFISEPDKGIYDAMNKGARHATGDYLIFMNAGDEFFSDDILKEVDAMIDGAPDVAYGNRCYVHLNGDERIDISRPMTTAHIRMPFCHQAAFYRRDVFDYEPYNITFKSAGDYNQSVQLFKAGKTFQKMDKTICRFFAGGLSESGIRAYLDVLMIQMDNFHKTTFKDSHYLKSFAATFEKMMIPYGIKPTPAAPSVIQTPPPEDTCLRFPVADTIDILRQIDLNQVLFIDRYLLSKRDEKEQKKLYDAMYRTTMFGHYPSMELQSDVLFVKCMHRPDYNQLFRMISDTCPVPYDYLNRPDQVGGQLNPEMVQAFMDFLPVAPLIEANTPLEREALYVQLLKHIMNLRVALTSPAKLAVVFSDMQPLDNLVSQAMALRGTKTATMQHALYVEYEGMDTINTVNYICQPSQNYLAWGPNTVDLMKKYHPDTKYYMCGKPNLVPITDLECEKAAILVIFDQRIFDESNRKVATIARNISEIMGLELRFRLHPQTSEPRFRRWFPSANIVPDIRPADVIVGHSSSLLLELFEAGHDVYQLRSEFKKISLPESLQFTFGKELRKHIEKNVKGDSLRKAFISDIGEKSIQKYREAFIDILRE